jgi:hypothetical protein
VIKQDDWDYLDVVDMQLDGNLSQAKLMAEHNNQTDPTTNASQHYQQPTATAKVEGKRNNNLKTSITAQASTSGKVYATLRFATSIVACFASSEHLTAHAGTHRAPEMFDSAAFGVMLKK